MIPYGPTSGQQSVCRGIDASWQELIDALLGATEPYWCRRCGVHRVDVLHDLCPVCEDG